jgi:hypothetical protein
LKGIALKQRKDWAKNSYKSKEKQVGMANITIRDSITVSTFNCSKENELLTGLR